MPLRSEDVLHEIDATKLARRIIAGDPLPPAPGLLQAEIGFLHCHLPGDRQEELLPHIRTLPPADQEDSFSTWQKLAEQHNNAVTCLGHLFATQMARHATKFYELYHAWRRCDPSSTLATSLLGRMRTTLDANFDGWCSVGEDEEGHTFSPLRTVAVEEMLRLVNTQPANDATIGQLLRIWQLAPLGSMVRNNFPHLLLELDLPITADQWQLAYERICLDEDDQPKPHGQDERLFIGRQLAAVSETYSHWETVYACSEPGDELFQLAVTKMTALAETPEEIQDTWWSHLPADHPQRQTLLEKLQALAAKK